MLTSSYYLIVANLIPLVGVLFFGWDAFSIILLYWAETFAVGFWWLLKIAFTNGKRSWFMVLFLFIHSGIFCLVEGIFIILRFPRSGDLEYYLSLIWLSWLSLFISHGVSFFLNTVNSNVTRVIKNKTQIIPSGPYERLLTMYIVIAICFSVAYIFRSQLAIIVLVIFKTTADLRGHLREYRSQIVNPKIRRIVQLRDNHT